MRYLSMSVDLIPSHALYDQYSACKIVNSVIKRSDVRVVQAHTRYRRFR